MSQPLVYTRGKRLALGAGATSAHWIAGQAMFALGDGSVLCAQGDQYKRWTAHDGAILCATPHPEGERLLTGGDDGRLRAVSPDGDIDTLADFKGKWIDHVIASADTGVIVAGVGKEAIVFKDGEESHRFTHPTTVGGLAFDAKGRRVAASHYGGVTLRYAQMAEDKGTLLPWAGSHLNVTFSPDGAFAISSMQENALHGWKLPEKTDLRMTGYAAKTRSMSWDKRGRWLATSGADVAVIWPFAGKLGPQGKEPLLLAARKALVTAVAFHPSEDMLALGYSDGAALALRLSDQAELDLDEPGEGAVTALSWSEDGALLALGDDAGRGAIIALT